MFEAIRKSGAKTIIFTSWPFSLFDILIPILLMAAIVFIAAGTIKIVSNHHQRYQSEPRSPHTSAGNEGNQLAVQVYETQDKNNRHKRGQTKNYPRTFWLLDDCPATRGKIFNVDPWWIMLYLESLPMIALSIMLYI
ncbi:hypothetical protein [Rahnella perminowiae]|uniref:hypothetical protein n=1 Tax=Rahnella perminowiae TaxID=2816244 RepID=UPI00215C2B36|nr:hypothetical protein [Rahnella perminowiae]MCR8998655.1 hypothetical protein [Rahnella perminowiae]